MLSASSANAFNDNDGAGVERPAPQANVQATHTTSDAALAIKNPDIKEAYSVNQSAIDRVRRRVSQESGARSILRNTEGNERMTDREDIREEIRDKLAAAEARTEVKLTTLGHKIDLVLQRIDGINTRIGEIRNDVGARVTEARADLRGDLVENTRSVRATLWAVGLGLAALFLAVALAVPAFVDMGAKIRDAAREEVKQQLQEQTKPKP